MYFSKGIKLNKIYINEDNIILDIYELIQQGIDIAQTQVLFYGHSLTGSKETPNNPLYFSSVDSKNELDETKPIYYLESNDEFDIESNITTNNQSNNNNGDSINSLHLLIINCYFFAIRIKNNYKLSIL